MTPPEGKLRSALSTVDRLTPNRTTDRPPPGITGGFSPCRMYVRMYAMQCMYVYSVYVYCVYVYCVYVSVCVRIQLYILYTI